MTRRQIEEVLRNKPYNQAASEIHKAFERNEMNWFTITVTIICVFGTIITLLAIAV